MKKNKAGNKKSLSHPEENNSLPDYPIYPPDEDIYSKYKKEDLKNGDLTEGTNEKPGKPNVKDFEEDLSGSDLDVPGSELDDEQENVGSEDEENNYYSLGGDDHDDLADDGLGLGK